MGGNNWYANGQHPENIMYGDVYKRQQLVFPDNTDKF